MDKGFDCVIIGGGAAGCFAAIEVARRCPDARVAVLERGSRPLAKVAITGGGRCNITNSFADVQSLERVYPRGHRLMKRLLYRFGPEDTFAWFEREGVELVTQDDGCVFPKSQNAMQVVNCLLYLMRKLGVCIMTETRALGIIPDGDGYRIETNGGTMGARRVIVTIGGQPGGRGYGLLEGLDIGLVDCVPSLYGLCVDDGSLRELTGTVIDDAVVSLTGTKLWAEGPLLITHWGLSGPAVLKLSSYAARILAERDYRADIMVRWLRGDREEIADKLRDLAAGAWGKQLHNVYPRELNGRLWLHLLRRAKLDGGMRWGALGDRERGRLVNVLAGDMYHVVGKNRFKEEFVTCGGVALSCLKYDTLETKSHRGLFFAGEAMDVDAVTGGFNLQAAWTTGYVAAQGAASAIR